MATGDLFDLYFHYVRETESPIIFHRWSLIAALGAWMGRAAYLPFGSGRIFPNQYIMLVGNPGARKSTAIKGVKKIISAAGYTSFAAEKTSKEKFLMDLQGEPDEGGEQPVINLFGGDSAGGIPREVLIAADEFNEFTGSGNTEFLSLLGTLWDWDDPSIPYKSRLKNSKSVEVYQPTVNILAGNTHSGFAEAFPVQILGQGFMSRLILVHAEPTGKRITIPPIPDTNILAALLRELGDIRSKVHGELTLSSHAFSALDSIYKTWEDLEDSRFKHYSTRRFTHLLKLCIILTAIGKRTEVLVSDVLFANTLLAFTEISMPKAMGELGRKRSSDVSSSLMNLLYETKIPLTISQLWVQLEKDMEHMNDLTRMLANLQAAGKIQVVKFNSNGRQESGFLPKQKAANTKQMYVDFGLLKGKELQ